MSPKQLSLVASSTAGPSAGKGALEGQASSHPGLLLHDPLAGSQVPRSAR